MSEVLVPSDNVQRRNTKVHQRTLNSAGVAASTLEHDRNSQLPHPGTLVGHKNGQVVNSDHQRPPGDRRQSTWERRPRSGERPLFFFSFFFFFSGTRHHLTAVLHLKRTSGQQHLMAELHLPRTDARHHHLTPGIIAYARHYHLTPGIITLRQASSPYARHHHLTPGIISRPSLITGIIASQPCCVFQGSPGFNT